MYLQDINAAIASHGFDITQKITEEPMNKLYIALADKCNYGQLKQIHDKIIDIIYDSKINNISDATELVNKFNTK
jgi:hypothetical protein